MSVMKGKKVKILTALSASRQARDAHAQSKKRVLVALSGGIDSAVSAYLLIKKGYKVEAAFMKNWTSQEGLLKNECPWLEDRRDALRVAAFLGIKLYTLDFEDAYKKTVMKYFFEEYRKGRTPNPDVMCNKEIKFKLLYNWAMKNNFDFLATGHYAQIKKTTLLRGRVKVSSRIDLLRSKDEFKDQTYFIYNIKKEQLPHLMFPIGGMKKTAVRLLARKIGLPNAEKKESMGLCFVGKIRLKDFLEQKLKVKKGEIMLKGEKGGKGNKGEEVVGEHQGLHNYTIGQRQGIKVGAGGPYFVYAKDLKHNRLFVTNNPDDERLLVKEVQLHSVNWLTNPLQTTKYKLQARYRHQGELVPLEISKIKKDLYQIIFKKPQKAVASGQSLVLYKGKVCVGGGVIV
jgi:tRNA-uridine 2-sulfurtransferase